MAKGEQHESGGTSTTLRAILLFLLVWGLGALGWQMSYPALSWEEGLYKSLQLFGLNFDVPDLAGSVHPVLNLVRFLAPGLAAAAVVAAFSTSFAANLRAVVRILRAKETALVIGYGDVGRALARALHRSRSEARIVAIDRRLEPTTLREARSAGIELFAADALDRKASERFPVRISRAETIVVACGDDATSMTVAEEIAARLAEADDCRRVVGGGVWMHISSRGLLEQLRNGNFGQAASGRCDVHPFGLDEAVVQDLLLRHPPALRARDFGLKRVHAVIHGFNEFAWTAAEQILLNGHMPGPGFATPLVSVIVPDAAAAEARWQARHPDLGGEIDIGFYQESDIAPGPAGDEEVLRRIEQAAPPSLHIISLADDHASITAGLGLREAMQRGNLLPAPIAIHAPLRGSSGIEPARQGNILQHALHVVGDLDAAARHTAFGNRILEGFARAVHEDYLALQGGAPFDDLTETLRVSNRRAAYHFIHKLRLLGFEEAGPHDQSLGIGAAGAGWLAGLSERASVQMDVLEHLRWRADRLLEGWRQGDRDDERRLRDQLRLGWTAADSMSALEKRKDRSQFEAFLAINKGSRAPAVAPRVEERAFEGALPRWTVDDGRLRLGFEQQPDWSKFAAGEAASMVRIAILLPREPELHETGCGDHNRRLRGLREAIRDFAAGQLAQMPDSARLRLQRVLGHGWNWLDPMDRLDGVVLPPPVFGFSGEGDLTPAVPELLDHLRRTVPQQGARLVTGCSTPADAAMIRLWKDQCLGPVHVVLSTTERREHPLLGDATILATPQLGESADQAVDRSILDLSNMLLAVEAKNEVIQSARERRMVLRMFSPAV